MKLWKGLLVTASALVLGVGLSACGGSKDSSGENQVVAKHTAKEITAIKNGT